MAAILFVRRFAPFPRMQNTMQNIRRALDARAKDIAALGRTRELSLALTTCQQGRMLLGNALRLLGSATPYPESSNPASAVVAPAVDVSGPDYEHGLPADPIAAVKTVRERIEIVITHLDAVRKELWPRHVGTPAETVFESAYSEILLVKNWLGMELADRGAERDRKAAAAAKKAQQDPATPPANPAAQVPATATSS